MVPSWIGTSYFLPVRLSVIVSVSAMQGARCLTLVRIVVGATGSGSSSSGHSARRDAVPPVSQRPRSAILQRSLQNGRQAGSTGFFRQ